MYNKQRRIKVQSAGRFKAQASVIGLFLIHPHCPHPGTISLAERFQFKPSWQLYQYEGSQLRPRTASKPIFQPQVKTSLTTQIWAARTTSDNTKLWSASHQSALSKKYDKRQRSPIGAPTLSCLITRRQSRPTLPVPVNVQNLPHETSARRVVMLVTGHRKSPSSSSIAVPEGG